MNDLTFAVHTTTLVFQFRQHSLRPFEKLVNFEQSWDGCQTYGCLFEQARTLPFCWSRR